MSNMLQGYHLAEEVRSPRAPQVAEGEAHGSTTDHAAGTRGRVSTAAAPPRESAAVPLDAFRPGVPAGGDSPVMADGMAFPGGEQPPMFALTGSPHQKGGLPWP